jgi:hypothetical protein
MGCKTTQVFLNSVAVVLGSKNITTSRSVLQNTQNNTSFAESIYYRALYDRYGRASREKDTDTGLLLSLPPFRYTECIYYRVYDRYRRASREKDTDTSLLLFLPPFRYTNTFASTYSTFSTTPPEILLKFCKSVFESLGRRADHLVYLLA